MIRIISISAAALLMCGTAMGQDVAPQQPDTMPQPGPSTTPPEGMPPPDSSTQTPTTQPGGTPTPAPDSTMPTPAPDSTTPTPAPEGTPTPPAGTTTPDGTSPAPPTDPNAPPTDPNAQAVPAPIPPEAGGMTPAPSGAAPDPNAPVGTDANPAVVGGNMTPPPEPKKDYPLCSKTIQDSCMNPGEAPRSKKRRR